MIAFSVKIKRRGDPRIQTRFHNQIIRESLIAAGEKWEKEYKALHFLPSAVQRYRYARRTFETNRIKAKMQKTRQRSGTGKVGPVVAAPKPPAPNVWSGAWRDKVTSSKLKVIATATSTKHTVRIKIPIPHPIHPDHRGEAGKLNNEEFKAMTRLAWSEYKSRMSRVKADTTTIIR